MKECFDRLSTSGADFVRPEQRYARCPGRAGMVSNRHEAFEITFGLSLSKASAQQDNYDVEQLPEGQC